MKSTVDNSKNGGAFMHNTSVAKYMQAKKRIGGKDAPINYLFEERVFCPGDTAPHKAAAKAEVLELLRSRILSAERPQWDQSTSNWDSMQMTGKCYKRTNINAERNMFSYNYRAEKLPKKNPTHRPKPNCFNTGIMEVAIKDKYVGEAFGDERVMKGIAKCTEELPNHPNLRDAKPWNQSVELMRKSHKKHFDTLEAARLTNSEKWRHLVGARDIYKSPELLSKELSARKRQEKQGIVAAITKSASSS
ncbi:hypothetical protein GN244_ATG00149 [Phytophthora infestans]|uniref:Uncharacterized protein n=1 Tax=Phytophthora infestans TaxID=4787 RepID=A0A833TND0_PHYIN|nr:hypothetical protein GN244_ATG00149 [Phytophthora infestans]